MVSRMSYCPLDEAWTLCKPLETNFEPENTKLEIGGYSLDNTYTPSNSSQLATYNLSDKQLTENKIESDFAAFIRDKNNPDQGNKERSRELIFQDPTLRSGNKSDFCKALFKHLDECPSCLEKMKERFSRGGSGNSNEILENFQGAPIKTSPNYLEILMIILIGIIIIVIMDCFVRLGKIIKN
jgi:hypothetical protein